MQCFVLTSSFPGDHAYFVHGAFTTFPGLEDALDALEKRIEAEKIPREDVIIKVCSTLLDEMIIPEDKHDV